jgi:chemotaxis protein MotD
MTRAVAGSAADQLPLPSTTIVRQRDGSGQKDSSFAQDGTKEEFVSLLSKLKTLDGARRDEASQPESAGSKTETQHPRRAVLESRLASRAQPVDAASKETAAADEPDSDAVATDDALPDASATDGAPEGAGITVEAGATDWSARLQDAAAIIQLAAAQLGGDAKTATAQTPAGTDEASRVTRDALGLLKAQLAASDATPRKPGADSLPIPAQAAAGNSVAAVTADRLPVPAPAAADNGETVDIKVVRSETHLAPVAPSQSAAAQIGATADIARPKLAIAAPERSADPARAQASATNAPATEAAGEAAVPIEAPAMRPVLARSSDDDLSSDSSRDQANSSASAQDAGPPKPAPLLQEAERRAPEQRAAKPDEAKSAAEKTPPAAKPDASQSQPAASGASNADRPSHDDAAPAVPAAQVITIDGSALQPQSALAPAPAPVAQIAARVVSEVPPAANPVRASGSSQPIARSVVKVLQIELQPANLGTITVRMELKDAGLTLHVQADRADTADLIRADEDTLSKLLRASGYDIGSGSIRFTEPDRSIQAAQTTQQAAQQSAQQNGQQGQQAGQQSGQQGSQSNLQGSAQSQSGWASRQERQQQQNNQAPQGAEVSTGRNDGHEQTSTRAGSDLYV